jgi:hypothetical protein
MFFYIPENIDFSLILNKNDYKHIDKFAYVISRIYEERVINKTFSKYDYVPLKFQYLAYIIGKRKISYILDKLIEYRLVERDNKYIVGQKSIGYRLTKKYFDCKFIKHEVKEVRLINKLIKRKDINIKDNIKLKPQEHLYNCLKQVNIDYKSALNDINRIKNKEKKNSDRISIDKIKNKDWFYVIDKISNRNHSNISNLSTDIRKHLKYKNKNLYNIDIKNSQPYIFSILIKRYINKLIKENISYESTLYINILEQEYKQYLELTSSGKFYEYIIEEFNKNGYNITNRKKFKKSFFGKIFFSSEKYIYEERKLFSKIFPCISHVISYYKQTDYRNLPIQLQKMESTLIIERVIGRLIEINPEIFVLTIHDSVITTEENVELVQTIIEEEFLKELGTKPGVNIELLKHIKEEKEDYVVIYVENIKITLISNEILVIPEYEYS